MGTELNNFRVLILDDNQSVHTFIADTLGRHDQNNIFNRLKKLIVEEKKSLIDDFFSYQVQSVFKIEQAVEVIMSGLEESNPFSLAFVNIGEAPSLDGIGAIKRIWVLDKNIQICILAPNDSSSWDEAIAGLGVHDNFLILKKPIDALIVHQIAQVLIRKWWLTNEIYEQSTLLEESIKQRSLQSQAQVSCDPLTSLLTRSTFIEQLNELITEAKNKKSVVAIFLLDLDRFKLVNDSFTHAFGDQLLKRVAERLRATTDKYSSRVARLGGDEFAVIIYDLMVAEEATDIAQEIAQVILQPFAIADREITITTSIGISLFPKDSTDPEVLLRDADTAMYKAKERGPNNFQYYTRSLNIHSLAKLELENQLFSALKNNEFILHYQPSFDLRTGKIISAEALIRWDHPIRGLISPLEFIPEAEETGLILPMGEWVLRTACMQAGIWQDKGFNKIRISVNISSRQFSQQNLVEVVQSALDKGNLEAKYLDMEVNESVIINNLDITQTVSALTKLGVQFALDNFGVGYSSLSYLTKLPISRIKIDKSYIQKINHSSEDENFIRAIVAMAKILKLKVVAEGVDTAEQLMFLKNEGCDEGQGFYFCRPLPNDEFEQFLLSTKIVI